MKKLKLNLPAVLLLLALLFVVIVRIRLLATPLERDEGEFAYGGQLMLQGLPPYQLFYNMKFPGIYAAYALLMALFGQSASGIHLGLLVVNIAGILLLYHRATLPLGVGCVNRIARSLGSSRSGVWGKLSVGSLSARSEFGSVVGMPGLVGSQTFFLLPNTLFASIFLCSINHFTAF